MEIFKDIKDYEGLYQISNYGTVKSLYREITNKNGKIQSYPSKVLKPEIFDMESSKYARVTLSKNHKTSRFLVHRLVAQHFIPNTFDKQFVNHVDNNGLNNHYLNLEWCTHSENMLHAQKQGRLFNSQSKGGSNSGITGEKALARIDAIIGTSIHLWHVNALFGKKGINQKYYVTCTCTGCNTTKEVEVSSLLNNKTKGCALCVRKLNKMKI